MKKAIVYDKWLAGLGGGEVVACTMAKTLLLDGYDVTLVSSKSVSAEAIFARLGIDLSGVNLTTKLVIDKSADIFINISFMDFVNGFAKKNIYYVHFPNKIESELINYRLLFFSLTKVQHLFPPVYREKVEDRLRAGVFVGMRTRLNSYDTFVTHSHFVAKWVKKYWNKKAEVLYPPVKIIVAKEMQSAKKNWIVSVGRFFTLGHGKKQDILIKAFKKLYDSGCSGWELHLVGGVGDEPSSVRYVEYLRNMAKEYPVHFHFNSSREELEEVLRKSRLYWHAAGYGEDERKDPVKFEHFGIAPVEAISVGCIPVLYNGGGLPEIIKELNLDPKIHLFSTLNELVVQTKNIIDVKDLYLVESTQTLLIDKFSSESFKKRFETLTS